MGNRTMQLTQEQTDQQHIQQNNIENPLPQQFELNQAYREEKWEKEKKYEKRENELVSAAMHAFENREHLLRDKREWYSGIVRQRESSENAFREHQLQIPFEQMSEREKKKFIRARKDDYHKGVKKYGELITHETIPLSREIKKYREQVAKEEKERTPGVEEDYQALLKEVSISPELFEPKFVPGRKGFFDIAAIMQKRDTMKRIRDAHIEGKIVEEHLTEEQKLQLECSINLCDELTNVITAILNKNKLDEKGEVTTSREDEILKRETISNGNADLKKRRISVGYKEPVMVLVAMQQCLDAQAEIKEMHIKNMQQTLKAVNQQISSEDTGEKIEYRSSFKVERKFINTEGFQNYEKNYIAIMTLAGQKDTNWKGGMLQLNEEYLQLEYTRKEREKRCEKLREKAEDNRLSPKEKEAALTEAEFLMETKTALQDDKRMTRVKRMLEGVLFQKPLSISMLLELNKDYGVGKLNEKAIEEEQTDALTVSVKRKTRTSDQIVNFRALYNEKQMERLEKSADHFENLLGTRTLEELTEEEQEKYKDIIAYMQSPEYECRRLNQQALNIYLNTENGYSQMKDALIPEELKKESEQQQIEKAFAEFANSLKDSVKLEKEILSYKDKAANLYMESIKYMNTREENKLKAQGMTGDDAKHKHNKYDDASDVIGATLNAMSIIDDTLTLLSDFNDIKEKWGKNKTEAWKQIADTTKKMSGISSNLSKVLGAIEVIGVTNGKLTESASSIIGGTAALVKDIINLGQNFQKMDGLSVLDSSMKILASASNVTKAGVSIAKTTGKVSKTVSENVASSMQIVKGSADIIIGGIQTYRYHRKRTTAEDLKQDFGKQLKSGVIMDAQGSIITLSEEEKTELNELMIEMEQIYGTAARGMVEGVVKSVTGALTVTGGALTLSGIASPVGLIIGGISSLVNYSVAIHYDNKDDERRKEYLEKKKNVNELIAEISSKFPGLSKRDIKHMLLNHMGSEFGTRKAAAYELIRADVYKLQRKGKGGRTFGNSIKDAFHISEKTKKEEIYELYGARNLEDNLQKQREKMESRAEEIEVGTVKRWFRRKDKVVQFRKLGGAVFGV